MRECEELLKCVQRSRDSRLDFAGGSRNMTFHIPSHPTIYIPLYPRFNESFQREFCERNPRENKIDSSTIFIQETLKIPLLSSSTLSNP